MRPTHFACQCVGITEYPPPEPKRGAARYGADAQCWLCGSETHGIGWPRSVAISETFTVPTLAAVPDSQTVCWQCAAMAHSETWAAYARRHPERGIKAGGDHRDLNWFCYSHAFAPSLGGAEHPRRERWRVLLVEPPEPPFLFSITTSGKKHHVFKGEVAYSRDCYPVQLDDERVFVHTGILADTFTAFEALYQAGFSKDEILSGKYAGYKILKLGFARWQALEAAITGCRSTVPGMMRLAAFCAQRVEE